MVRASTTLTWSLPRSVTHTRSAPCSNMTVCGVMPTGMAVVVWPEERFTVARDADFRLETNKRLVPGSTAGKWGIPPTATMPTTCGTAVTVWLLDVPLQAASTITAATANPRNRGLGPIEPGREVSGEAPVGRLSGKGALRGRDLRLDRQAGLRSPLPVVVDQNHAAARAG